MISLAAVTLVIYQGWELCVHVGGWDSRLGIDLSSNAKSEAVTVASNGLIQESLVTSNTTLSYT